MDLPGSQYGIETENRACDPIGGVSLAKKPRDHIIAGYVAVAIASACLGVALDRIILAPKLTVRDQPEAARQAVQELSGQPAR